MSGIWHLCRWPQRLQLQGVPFMGDGGASLNAEKAHLVNSFSLTTPPPPIRTKPPRLSHPRGPDFGPLKFSAPFGSVRVRLAPFGSVSGLFWARCGSVSGCWVGSGRVASASEKNITSLTLLHEKKKRGVRGRVPRGVPGPGEKRV